MLLNNSEQLSVSGNRLATVCLVWSGTVWWCAAAAAAAWPLRVAGPLQVARPLPHNSCHTKQLLTELEKVTIYRAHKIGSNLL